MMPSNARQVYMALRPLVDQALLLAQSGGGSAGVGFVFIRPINGIVDDAPNIHAVEVANAYKNIIVMLEGTAGQSFQILSDQLMPSGTTILGTPGTIVQQPNAGSTLVQAAFQAIATAGAILTLSADVPRGASSVSLTTSLPAGSLLLLAQATGAGSVYVTGVPTGGGPFNIPLDRVTTYAFLHTTSLAQQLVNRPQDIYIFGNGMRISGPKGNGYVRISEAGYRVQVQDVIADASAGNGALMIAFLYDSYSVECEWIRCRSTGATKFGIYFAENERCRARDCYVSNATDVCYFAETSAECEWDGCVAEGFPNIGFNLSASASAIGCTNCNINGGRAYGGITGVQIDTGSTGCTVTGFDASYNGTGFVFTASAGAIANCGLVGCRANQCTVDGLAIDATNTGSFCEGCDFSTTTTAAGINTASDLLVSDLIFQGTVPAPGTGSAALIVTGSAVVRLDGLEYESATQNAVAITQSGTSKLSVTRSKILVDDSVGFPIAFQPNGTGVLSLSETFVGGAHAARISGVATTGSGSTTRIGHNVNMDQSARAYTIAGGDFINFSLQAPNTGPAALTANGTTPVAVAFPNLTTTDQVFLQRIGGAIAAAVAPGTITKTPGTGFSYTGSSAADLGTYDWRIVG